LVVQAVKALKFCKLATDPFIAPRSPARILLGGLGSLHE
jgi:hypothetical protein